MIAGMFLSLLLALGSAQIPWQTQQENEAHQRTLRLAGEHYDTVMLYKQGHIDAALQRLNANTRDEQLAVALAVDGIVRQKKAEMRALAGGEASASRPTSRGGSPPPPNPNVIPVAALRWTVDLMPAAGALQMEAAIMATRRRTAAGYDEAVRQIGVADVWFEKYTELTEEANPARRWKLVIGLMMMAHGTFGRVATLLDPECAAPDADTRLQLACGSAHESTAMFPADLTLATASSALASRRARPASGTNPLNDLQIDRMHDPDDPVRIARDRRNDQLKKAQAMFEMVVKADPRNVEARIRLANVRMLLQDDARAAALLTPLVGESLEPRAAYLSRLFLSRVKIRAKQFGEAARLLEEAIRVMPSGQSAYVGLAQVARQSGTAAAADVLQRMLKAPDTPDDPWVSYRFGQYWVADALVKELRSEVRR